MINFLSLVLFDAVTWPYRSICLSHYILCIPQRTWHSSRNLIQMPLLSMSWFASWDKVTICTMYGVTNIVPLKRSTGVSYRLLEVSWTGTGKLKKTLALSQIKMLTIQMSYAMPCLSEWLCSQDYVFLLFKSLNEKRARIIQSIP